MLRRLLVLHYSTTPQVGGLEYASWELAAAASRTPGWQAVLVTGTNQMSDSKDGKFRSLCIREIATDYPLNRKIFADFRRGIRHPAIERVALPLCRKIDEIIRPGDLLVSLNCFSLPFNVSLTDALWTLTQTRHDFVHVTWSWDIAAIQDEYEWVKRSEWPWNLFWQACPGLVYAACTAPVAFSQARSLGIEPSLIRIIPGGVDPSRCLRLPPRISRVCREKRLFAKYPLLFMPAKISSRKNIPRAIRVLEELRADYPQAHLVIAGSLSPHDSLTKDASNDLLEDIRSSGLGDAATILGAEDEFDGAVSFYDAMSMMAISDGVLFTSNQEGFLFPVLEAGLHNVPIFVPALETITSWSSDYSIAYPISASPKEIAGIIGDVFSSNLAARKALFRTEYTWDSVFSRYFIELATS